MPHTLITGASYGIGAAIAEELLSQGHHVWGVSRTSPQLKHENFTWIKADLTQDDDLQTITQSLKDGQIDVLVNNAGTAILSPEESFSQDDYEKTFNLNFIAPIKLYNTLKPHLSPHANIINISSLSDRYTGPGWGLYSASKAALTIYFDAIAADNEVMKIINILPTYVDTPLQRGLPDTGIAYEEMLQPDDVAKIVVKAIKNKKLPTGSRIMVANDVLKEDFDYQENLWSYNVDEKEFTKT